jgi:hypothetical protein
VISSHSSVELSAALGIGVVAPNTTLNLPAITGTVACVSDHNEPAPVAVGKSVKTRL